MHTWAKRGLQTALVTGGLLMLGTGIASAEENVDPDRPASPIDASVSVPMHIANNVVGTPMGPKTLPAINREATLSTDDVTNALPTQAKSAAAPVTKDVTAKAAPIMNKAGNNVLGHDVFRGNRVNADLVVPVDVSGNAIALGGKAQTTNDSSQAADTDRPVTTQGRHTLLGGNVVDADWAAPVQVTGNAVSALGVANTHNYSSQEASSTGDIQTDGTKGVLSGNLVAPQFATPVQVTGNAVTGAGKASAVNESDSSATSGGTLAANGNHALLSGNAAGGPLATPVEVNGNPVAGLGHASTLSNTSANATSGDTQTGPHKEMAYILTNGDPAVGSGNAAQPGHAGPVALNCNAAAGVGVADCTGQTTTDSTAGGATETTGHSSVASGAIASAPSAAPVEVFGNTAGAGGTAATATDNATSTQAGGSTYTNGGSSLASGTLATAPVCAPVDAFGNVASGAGGSHSTTTNALDCAAGGAHDGSTGDDSAGGGNTATVPVSVPTEVFGNGAAGVGTADTLTTENKTSTAGGESNTNDDAGTLAANLVTAPVAGAGQAYGNGAGVLGYTNAHSDTTTESTAGNGRTRAKGTGGKLAGNLAQVPVTLPAQLVGNGATAGGRGHTGGTNDASFTAGGPAETTGDHGFGAGNIVATPAGTVTQVEGAAAGALGKHNSAVDNATDSTAGGDLLTTGEHGFAAGNVVSPQALPISGVFGDSAAGAGHATSLTDSTIDAASGGDIATNGDHGFLSGNLAHVPAAAVPQVFGDAAGAVGGVAGSASDSQTNGAVGGTTTTSGRPGSLSGLNAKLPVGAVAPVYDVPVEVLGKAFTQATNGGAIVVGDRDPQLFVPVDGGLGANQLPRIPHFPFTPMRSSLPAPSVVPGLNAPEGLPFAGDLAGDMVQLPSVPSVGSLPTAGLPGIGAGQLPTADVPAVSSIAPGEPTGGLPAFGGLFGALPGVGQAVPALPGAERADMPTAQLPVIGDAVPAVPGLPAVPAVPSLPAVGDGVPSLPAVGGGVPALPGVGDAVPAVPALPAVGDGVPALPAVPGLAQADLPTAQLPVIGQGVPALPGADLPTAQLPVVGKPAMPLPTPVATPALPVNAVPAMAILPMAAVPALPAATPALPAMDAAPALPADTASLADTAAKLQALFGQLPSVTSLPMA
ncbi:beta strand repeat-containing protein [Labedaea rhizosphaerae]|uniref:Chaplin domain-containing protein n=1 Tax=Labedaea rhizosphaerae TaxID=598644 RepID=A0A4R6SM57_LABRH|nr:chaplin family protein [Labedaea rhizosphaerae]TDQ05209.1 hypothetical protein EV186_1011177 [Labedaea rhizosphaerae]